MSLASYSKPYQEGQRNRELTKQGESINFFKYHHYYAGKSQIAQISLEFEKEVFIFFMKELGPKLPFDVCLGVPENRGTGISLPRNICKLLSEENISLKDGFEGVSKTRDGVIIKNIPYDERPVKVAGLYSIDRNKMPVPKFGFLVIDDVFETGSTVSGLCKTLESEYPGVPRYIIALTHLRATERLAK